MTAPQFEALKARALAGQAIPMDEIAAFTPEQSEEFTRFCREQAGYVLDEGPDPRKLYGE